MSDNFYRAFEERHRGSRELIKSRLAVYLPFIKPLHHVYQQSPVLDLGCGRGEWLEVISGEGIPAMGIDSNQGMLGACYEIGLPVEQGDAIAYLSSLADDSQTTVSAFHLVEHLAFDQLRTLVSEALRVLKPGGLLIMETPNPENIVVGTCNFYLDPTHQRPIPSQLLSFLPEYYGFNRTKVLRMQESKDIAENETPTLQDVLGGVSPDYAVIAQKHASPEILSLFDELFSHEYGFTLNTLAARYDHAIASKAQQAEDKAQQAEGKAQQAEGKAQQAEGKAQQAEDKAQQAEGKAQQAEGKAQQAEDKAQQAEGKAQQAEDKAQQAEDKAQQAEGKAQQAEGKAQQAEGKAQQAEDKAQQAEGKAQQAEDKAQQAEGKAQQAEGKAQQAEGKAQQAEDKAQQAEGKAQQAEDKAQQAEGKAQQAEDKAQQAEGKAQQAEDKAQQAEDKAQQAEGKAQQAEDKAQQAEGKAQQAEGKAQQAEGKAQQAEDKAQQAEGKAQQAATHLNDVLNSTSWRIMAPARWFISSVRGVKAPQIALKPQLKLLLQHARLYVGRRPWLKQKSLIVLNQFPNIKSRLIRAVHGNMVVVQTTPVHEVPTDLAHLTPRTRQIYADLTAAIERHKRENG